MNSTIDSLATFSASVKADDLPESVVEYTKLVLADTVVSGLCAGGLQRAAMAHDLARQMGGTPQALVLGTNERQSALSASYANADLMNLLDADETFFNGAHFAAMSFAPAMAEAERLGTSGSELLRSAAVSFDINARLNLGTSLMEYDGENFRFSQLSSHGYAALGAAVAVGLLSGQTTEQIANGMGLATWLAPTAKNGYMSRRRRFNSLKYAPNGQIAHAGMTAAMMASLGYEGDWDSLDTSPGFLEAQGYNGGDRDAIVADFGSKWWITETSLKPYPSCRYSHAALDALRGLRRNGRLEPTDVVSIDVRLSPAAYSISQFRDPIREIPSDHLAPYAVQFNMATLTALALLDIAPGPQWHRPEVYNASEVRALADKVVVSEDPILAKEWRTSIVNSGEKVQRTRGSVLITTHDTEEFIETEYALGDPWLEDTRFSWELLADKLETFGQGLLDRDVQARILEGFQNLDQMTDVSEDLVPLLHHSAPGATVQSVIE